MDYDFITTCNWTATGTYKLQAFRGSGANVVTTYHSSIFYRKKGTSTWTALDSSGQMVVNSTGEWEVANNWNKLGNDCLTHSYYGITAIDSCTDVYFNETSLGATVGHCFLMNCWRGCTSLASMPSGFNLPTGITSVGDSFLYYCWYGCTSLSSMPIGFNIPTGITSVGGGFLSYCWSNCTSLTSMPSGFNLPTGITSAGSNFLNYCWSGCTLLNNDRYTEDIYFKYASSNTFGGTCPITPDSPTAGSSVAVNRPQPEPAVTTQACTDIARTSVTGNGNITGIGNSTPTIRGFCYKPGTAGDPTTSDSTVSDTGTFSTGAFTKAITGLTGNTSYRVRAYAINSDGTGYGDTVTVTTAVGISGTVTLSGTGVSGAVVRIIRQDTDEEVEKQTTDVDGNYKSDKTIIGKKYHVCVEYTDGSSNKYNSKSLWDIEAK